MTVDWSMGRGGFKNRGFESFRTTSRVLKGSERDIKKRGAVQHSEDK